MATVGYRNLPYQVPGCAVLVQEKDLYKIKSGAYAGTIFKYQINTDTLRSINRDHDKLEIPWRDIIDGHVQLVRDL